MAKIHIVTQYSENYDDPDWDGQGECPQIWKNNDSAVGEYYCRLPADYPLDRVAELVEHLKPHLEFSSEDIRVTVVKWEVMPDDFLSEGELQQLTYYGNIDYPVPVLNVPRLAPSSKS